MSGVPRLWVLHEAARAVPRGLFGRVALEWSDQTAGWLQRLL